MARSKKRFIKHQKLGIKETNTNYSGERSPYWDWVSHIKTLIDNEETSESVQANPDSISETKGYYPISSNPETNNIRKEQITLLNKAMQHLSPKEYQVICLKMEEKSNKEIASQLDISTSAVQQYILRAKRKFKKVLFKKPILV